MTEHPIAHYFGTYVLGPGFSVVNAPDAPFRIGPHLEPEHQHHGLLTLANGVTWYVDVASLREYLAKGIWVRLPNEDAA